MSLPDPVHKLVTRVSRLIKNPQIYRDSPNNLTLQEDIRHFLNLKAMVDDPDLSFYHAEIRLALESLGRIIDVQLQRYSFGESPATEAHAAEYSTTESFTTESSTAESPEINPTIGPVAHQKPTPASPQPTSLSATSASSLQVEEDRGPDEGETTLPVSFNNTDHHVTIQDEDLPSSAPNQNVS